jgi:MFS family permease
MNKEFFNFYILIFSRLLSNFGTFLNMLALNIFILEITNNPKWIAIIMGVRIISGIVVSPFLGYISDKFSRKPLMIFSDFTLAIFVFLLILIPDNYVKSYIIILMIFIGIFSNLFDICLRASIPAIINDKNTLKANSILMGGTNFTIALSGLCAVFFNYLFKNFTSIFILDALTYLISGIVLISLKIKTSQIKSSNNIVNSLFKELKQDYKGLFKLDNFKIISLFLFILFLDAIASASHNIGWPIFSKSLNEANPMFYYGLILASWAIGNLIGIITLNVFKMFKKMDPRKLYVLFTGVMSLGMILIFQTRTGIFIALASIFAGFGDGTYQTYYTTYVQNVPDKARGKIFALTTLVVRTGLGIGFVIMPFILNYLRIQNLVFIFHLPIVLISTTYLAFFGIFNHKFLIKK